MTSTSVPILPPEESQRMGYPVIAALEARVEDARAVAERLRARARD